MFDTSPIHSPNIIEVIISDDTNFEKVSEFNTCFGLPHFNTLQTTLFADTPTTENLKLINLRIDLCIEEIEELNEAFDTKNFIEVIDALTDELYVLYGAGSSFGIDLDAEFKKKIYELYSCEQDISLKRMTNYDLLRYKIEHGNKLDYIPLTIQKDLFNAPILDKIIDLKNNINNLVEKLNATKTNLQKNIELLILLLIDTYKMGIYLGINLNKSFDIVHRSNMSKLCKTEEEAEKTVQWYTDNDGRYDTPDYRKSDNNQYWVVYNKSSGKILKSINYTPANFDSLLV
tara:strand:+ start:1158 stop:2021 length:864 start_codon:yes stop_codon:yes gene_type:complete